MALKITNYLKNLGKSVQYATAYGFKNKYETTYKNFDQASTATKETVNAIVNYRQTFKKAQDYLEKSPIYESGKFALKNAKEDIKSGELWNQTRADKIMFGDDDDDFDWNFDEDQIADDSSISDMTDGDKAVAKSVYDASKANADQVSGAILNAAEYNASVTKQTASFMFAQQERLFGKLNSSIITLGNTMGNMQSFMTTNMQTHIENSTKYFEESTKYQRENNAILKEILDMERERFKDWNSSRLLEKKRQDKGLKKDITDILYDGVMDWGAYAKHIRKGFMDQADTLGLSLINKDMMMMQFAANPLQAIPSYLVEKAMGKPLEKAIGKFNTTLTGLFNQINADLLQNKNNSGISGILANIFGVNISKKDKIDTSNYNKGQVPFDGITRKSIVEVIPNYLSRIEKLLGGEERLYDFDKGKFTSRSQIKKDKAKQDKSYRDSGTYNLRSALKQDSIALGKSMNLKGGMVISDEDIEDIASAFYNSGGSWDAVMDQFRGSRVGQFLKGVSSSKNSKTRRARKTAASDVAFSKKSKSESILLKEKSGDSVLNNLYNDSGKFAGNSSIISANADMQKTANEHTNILKGMLAELYMIRTSKLRKGNRLGRINRYSNQALPAYLDKEFIKTNIVKETRAKISETAANKSDSKNSKSSDNKIDAASMSDEEYNESLNKGLEALGSDSKNEFDEVTNAKGVKGKGKALAKNWWKIVRSPRLFLSEVITKVDDNLYDFFFNHETGEKDSEGNEIHGFFDKMAFELKSTFNSIKQWVREKFFDPIIKKGWGKVKDFAKSVGLDWFNEAKESFKDSAVSAAKSSINAFAGKNNNTYGPAFAYGTMYAPETALTTISKGEAVIPSDANPFNPNRDKSDRKKDLQNELRLQRSILTHADGGNKLDNGGLSKSIKDRLPEQIRNNIKGNSAGDIMGGLLEFAISNLSGKVDGFDGNVAGEAVKASISAGWNKGLDKVDKFAKNLDPDVGKALSGDIAKLRGNTAKFAGRTGFASAVGALGGAAILGPGGLLAGAAVGAAANIIKESDTAKNFLFGKELADGSRAGGLISRKQQALFKKYMPDLGKGAAAGIIPSLLLGFGPVGAISIGGAYSLAKNNKTVNEKIFGKTYYDKDGKPIGSRKGIIPKKVQDYIKKNMPKIAGFGGAAALLDPTGMGLLVNFGLGAGLGLLGTSNKFRDMMLGKKNEKGKREGGLVGAIKRGVINPLQRFGHSLYHDFYKFMDYNLFSPLKGTGKLLAQSIKNIGRSMKYGLFNVLEKAFGNPFSHFIGKQVSNMLLKPLGGLLGRSIGGIGSIGKFALGLTPRLIGGGLRRFNKWGNKKMIRKGQADHLSAQERLNVMGEEDYEYKERDKMLSTASAKDLGELEANLNVFASQFKIGGGDTKKEVKWVEKSLAKNINDASAIKKLTKLIFDGNSRDAFALVGNLGLDSKAQKNVVDIIKKGIERIAIAKGKKKFSKEQLASASDILKKYGIDATDRKSLGIALDQVRDERERADSAERLVGANGEKFTSEGAANVAEGMQTTNSLLSEIRDALIKSNNGSSNNEYFNETDKKVLSVNSTLAQNRLDWNNKPTVDKTIGHLKYTGTETNFFTGKKNKGVREALKNMPKDMEIDLDVLAKMSKTGIKRYSELAMVMGPGAIKSIGDPSKLEKMSNGSFKSIIKIATYMTNAAKSAKKTFVFKDDISSFIRMKDEKLEFIGRLIGYGLDPALWKSTADYAWDNRGKMTSGIYTPEQYVELCNEINNGKDKSKNIAPLVNNNIVSNALSSNQSNEISSTKSSSRYIDKDGNEVYTSTDGSKNKADTESENDKKKEKAAEDEKNAERQGSIFSKALSKIKGFGSSVKDGAKIVKEKSGGFLHDIADWIFGKGSIFGGLGTILQGGLLMTFIAPMLPEIGKILTHTLLPAIGSFLKDTVLPMFIDGIKDSVSSLVAGFFGKEEKQEVDANGNPVYNPDGTPKMNTSYNPTMEGMLVNGGLLGLGGAAVYKAGKKVYNVAKSIASGVSKGIRFANGTFNFAKEFKDTKSFSKAFEAGRSVYMDSKIIKDMGNITKTAEDVSKAGRLGKLTPNLLNRALSSTNPGKTKLGLDVGNLGNKFLNTAKGIANKGLNTMSKVGGFVKSTISTIGDVASKAGGAVLEFLKNLLTKGIEKISGFIPKLAERGMEFAPKLANMIINGIKSSGKFGKLVAKAGAYVGICSTGIGGIILGIITALDLGASIAQCSQRWYNVADCLADEEPPSDDVKWVAGLAGAIDSVFFGIIGPQLFFKILSYIFGLSDALIPMQQRALQALNQYNQTAEKKVETIEDYNNDVYDKDRGFIDDVKGLFNSVTGKDTKYKPNKEQLASQNGPTNTSNNQGTGKSGPTITGAKGTGTGIIGGMQSDLSKVSNASSGLMGGLMSSASELKSAIFGTGKYFKQTDPKYANIRFNTSKDSITQTIGDSGCGPVAGVNALKALGAGTINPAEASSFALSGGYKGTDTGISPSFFEDYAASHGATSYSTDARGTISALQSGNPVILQGESKSGTSSSHPFGSYPHYVTATGYDPSTGKVTIQDPESNRDNSKYNIKDVLRNTTTANAFTRGRGRYRIYGRGSRNMFNMNIRLGRGADVPESIWNFLFDKGVSSVAIAGIMGNMWAESRYNPSANQLDNEPNMNPYEAGVGLCQWTETRKDALNSVASRMGTTWSDLNAQLAHLWNEIGPSGPYHNHLIAMCQISDVGEATKYWFTNFEAGNPEYAHMDQRIAAAEEAFKKQGKGIKTAGNLSGGSQKKPGLLSPLFDMYNSIKSNLGAVLGIDFGGNSSSSSSGGPVAGGNTKAASNWADSMVGQEGFGSDGCTKFVNKYLDQAGVNEINGYVPTAESEAKEGKPYAFKSADKGGVEGDVVLINTLKGDAEADHAVIADGKGGYWGNSSSRNKIVKGSIADDFGSENINGYISTGNSSGSSGNVPSGSATRPESEIIGDSTTMGTGKNFIGFGRAKGVPKETQIAIEGMDAFRKQQRSIKAQMRFGRGTDDITQPQSSDSEELILLRGIYTELTKITGNTAGISALQATQAQTQQQVSTVQSGLQGAIAGLGNKLNDKINLVSQNLHGKVNEVTKNVSGNTINKLQYLAAK